MRLRGRWGGVGLRGSWELGVGAGDWGGEMRVIRGRFFFFWGFGLYRGRNGRGVVRGLMGLACGDGFEIGRFVVGMGFSFLFWGWRTCITVLLLYNVLSTYQCACLYI